MTKASAGAATGEAADLEDNDEFDVEEFAAQQAQVDHQTLVDNVEKAKAKVEQAEGHLDAAREALKNAEAELEG